MTDKIGTIAIIVALSLGWVGLNAARSFSGLLSVVFLIVAGILVLLLIWTAPRHTRLPLRQRFTPLVFPAVIIIIVIAFATSLRRPHIDTIWFTLNPIIAGVLVSGVATFVNNGPVEAQEAAVFNYVYTKETPLPNEEGQVEDDLWKDFTTNHVTNAVTTNVLPPNIPLSQGNSGTILTQSDVDNFKSGRNTFYFLGTIRYTYRGGFNYSDYCRYANRSGTFSCLRHNGER